MPQPRQTNSAARWIAWGTGVFHIQPLRDDEATTVCGRDIPDDARLAVWSGHNCSRCIAKAPELAAEAERDRKARSAAVQERRDGKVAANRRGEFVVYRCRKCGAQHHLAQRGIPFCMSEMHEADLEVLEVTGPAWQEGAHDVA